MFKAPYWQTSISWLAILAGLWLAGCSSRSHSSTERSAAAADQNTASSAGGTGEASGTSAGVGVGSESTPNQSPTPANPSCSDTSGHVFAPLLLHPLTDLEYNANVEALLGTTARPSATFPPINAAHGFFNTNPSARSLDSTMVQQYLAAATSLASAYTARTDIPCVGQKFAASCTGAAILTLAQTAFRRPLTTVEQHNFSGLPAQFISTASASTQEAYTASVVAVLMSPQFIFRAAVKPNLGVNNPDQYALAANLSAVLWSAPPDATLLSLAESGQLANQTTISAQALRMLGDARSASFAQEFAGQWLGLPLLANAPSAATLPSGALAGFSQETLAFFSEFMTKNLNIKSLLDAPFTYVTPPLASLYGLANVTSATPVRVNLTGNSQRGGILSQGNFLAQTSNPNGTSAVKRGKWVLDNILCTPPPPAPPNVSTTIAMADQSLSQRAMLAQHAGAAQCSGCHSIIDPVGLAYENYGIDGSWRTQDGGAVIDASGTTSDGQSFQDAASLNQLLKVNPAFPRCMVTNMATYSLGRAPGADELCLVQSIASKTSSPTYGLRDLTIDLIVALQGH